MGETLSRFEQKCDNGNWDYCVERVLLWMGLKNKAGAPIRWAIAPVMILVAIWVLLLCLSNRKASGSQRWFQFVTCIFFLNSIHHWEITSSLDSKKKKRAWSLPPLLYLSISCGLLWPGSIDVWVSAVMDFWIRATPGLSRTRATFCRREGAIPDYITRWR